VSGSDYYVREWPKIDGYKQKSIVVDHDQLKNFIDALDQDRRNILKGGKTGHGYPQDLVDAGKQLQPQQVGATGNGGPPSASYPAGEVIWQSIQNVRDHFPAAYLAFMNSYKEVVDGMYEMAGIYSKSELDSQVNSSGSTPTTDPFAGNNSQA
jgi:hypothetical protein